MDASQDVCEALSQGLDVPVAALRASMESLFREIAGSTVREPMVNSALAEVMRLGRNVQELVDYATPRAPSPLRCSVREILVHVARGLDKQQRSQLFIAQDDPAAHLLVDGPILGAALRRLVQNSFEAGTKDVLLAARREELRTLFTVVDRAPTSFDMDWAQEAFHSTKPNQLGLGLSLVRRDVELLHGTLDFRNAGSGVGTCVILSVPNTPAGHGEARS